MMGGMLAGHDQSGGEIIEKNGRKVSFISRIRWACSITSGSIFLL
jgi:IMP dehydrogenase/GMP reductase